MPATPALCLAAALAAWPLLSAAAAEPAVPLTLSRAFTHRLTSSAVGDTFVIQVRLPENYEPATTRYQVLYVLDGDFWFGAASDIASYLPMVQESPPMIVVGIAYGGTFATYTLFTRPELFQGYIILAPGLGGDKRRLFEMEAAFRTTHPRLPATVFFAIGDQDKPGMVANWRKFDEQVVAHHYEGLRWTSRVLPAETHISVYPVGLTRGLKTIHASPAAGVPSHP